jgi:Neuraminidase (sialidase)
MTRRGFLASIAATVRETTTITQDARYYYGWPTVTRRSNGELLVVTSGGRESHVCPFGRVEMLRSRDNGKTWTWPEVLMDTAIDDRDAGICETSRGTLLVTTFTSLAYEPALEKATNWAPERLAMWNKANDRLTPAQRKSLLGTWMLRSTDSGLTWSAPYRVPLNSPHGPASCADGRLVYAGKKLWDAQKQVGVAESTDDGVTWRWISNIPARPGDSFENYHELHIVEAADKRLVVQIRNHNDANKGETLQTESTDGGKTWSTPRSIGVWGLPSHLLRLRDGRLLMSYGYRQRPYGNKARVSTDNGKAWSEPVTISGDGMAGDLGYPSTVELGNGDLLTVWYELQAGSLRAVLRQARWRLS